MHVTMAAETAVATCVVTLAETVDVCSTDKSVVVYVAWLAEFVACSLVADVATTADATWAAAMQVVVQLLPAVATSLLNGQ